MKASATPTYGWGPAGQRVVEGVPHGHGETIALAAAPRSTGLSAPVVVGGAVSGEPFRAYARRQLARGLRPGAWR